MKKLVTILFLIILVGCSAEAEHDWTGYYYPDKDNIGDESQWVIQPGFKTIEDCGAWVLDVAGNNTNYDYECGYKCTYRKEFEMNVCERTERLENDEGMEKSEEDTNFLTNTYTNEDLGFSIKYPTNWSLRDYEESEDDTASLSFANSQEDFDNIFEMPEGYKSVGIGIYKIDSYKYDNGYKNDFLVWLDRNERLEGTEITTYEVNGKELTLYVNETEATFEASSIVEAQAFYKGKNYAYSFGINQENYRDKEASRLIIEEYLKPMLSTFEDLGGDVKTESSPTDSKPVDFEPEGNDLAEAFISIPDINTLNRSENGAYYIYGTTSDNCESVKVTASNPIAGIEDSYFLKQYQKGDTSFKYGIREDEDFDNLAVGSNTYTFIAYCDGGQVKKQSTTLEYTVKEPTHTYKDLPTIPNFWDGYAWAEEVDASSFLECQNQFWTEYALNGCNQYVEQNYGDY